MRVLAIDIGGTKTTLSVGSLDGEIFGSRRIATCPNRAFNEFLEELLKESHGLLNELGLELRDISSIGVAAPGPLDVKKGLLISPPNLPKWNGENIVQKVSDLFQCPVVFNNDGNAACLAEYYFGRYGRKSGHGSLVYLTMSTGIGGGAVISGKLIQGASDSALEVGHMVIDPSGPRCACGQRGCFEAYCGGSALAKRVQMELDRGAKSSLCEHSGSVRMEEIIQAVREEDPFAVAIFDEFLDRLAQGISIVVMTLNPEVVLLGTIAVHAQDLIIEPVKKRLKALVWPFVLEKLTLDVGTLQDALSPLCGIALVKAKE